MSHDKCIHDNILIVTLFACGRVSTNRLIRSLRQLEIPMTGSPGGNLLGRIKWCSQVKTRPPTFAFLMRGVKELDKQQERFLVNTLRDLFDLQGIPLRTYVR